MWVRERPKRVVVTISSDRILSAQSLSKKVLVWNETHEQLNPFWVQEIFSTTQKIYKSKSYKLKIYDSCPDISATYGFEFFLD